jgi:hypothetical protein
MRNTSALVLLQCDNLELISHFVNGPKLGGLQSNAQPTNKCLKSIQSRPADNTTNKFRRAQRELTHIRNRLRANGTVGRVRSRQLNAGAVGLSPL